MPSSAPTHLYVSLLKVHTHIHTHACSCTHTHTHTRTHTCACSCTHTHTHTHTHTRAHVHTHTHTQTHTHACSCPHTFPLPLQVTAIFACQLYLLYSSVKPTHDQSSAFPSAGGMPMGAGEGDMPSSPFYSPSAATTTPTASSASFAATSATDAGLGMGSQQQQFWAQRLELLQVRSTQGVEAGGVVAGEINTRSRGRWSCCR